MSVNGVSGIPAALLRPQETVRQKPDQERPYAAPAPQNSVVPSPGRVGGAGLLAPRQDTLPLEAPAGTDSELWQVLTSEERAYFAKISSMGPLTYGRPSAPTLATDSPMVRGGRLDVKA
jgi:hypothetical protein